METLDRKKKQKQKQTKQKKPLWVTHKAFLNNHNMATRKPSSTASDHMNFCEMGQEEGEGQPVTPVRSQNR